MYAPQPLKEKSQLIFGCHVHIDTISGPICISAKTCNAEGAVAKGCKWVGDKTEVHVPLSQQACPA